MSDPRRVPFTTRTGFEWLVASFAAVMFASWTFQLVLDGERLVSVVPDDAFYYLQVADNIAAGRGSTFDSINQTNGYHPLWMAVLVPLRWVSGDIGRLTFVRIVLVLQAVITVTTAGLIWHSLRNSVSSTAALAGILFFTIASFNPITGLETSLVSFTIALGVWLLITNRRPIVVGVCMAAIALARLDFALVVVSLGLAWIILEQDGRRTSLQTLALRATKIFLVPALAGLAYLVFNRVVFGHPLPVTFSIKTTVHPDLRSSFGDALAIYGSRIVYAPLLVAPSLVLLYRRRTGRRSTPAARRFEIVGAALGLGTLVHVAYIVLSVGFGPSRWHLIPHGVAYALCVGLVTSFVAELLNGRLRRLAVGGIIIVVACLLSVASNARVVGRVLDPPASNSGVQLYHTALWIDANTPADAIVGLSDAGIVGYFSERSVVNLDGLVNSFETFEAIRDDGLCDKLRDEWGVDHFVSLLPASNRPGYRSQVLRLPGWAGTTTITVLEEDELFRSRPSGDFTVGVWDYSMPDCTSTPPNAD